MGHILQTGFLLVNGLLYVALGLWCGIEPKWCAAAVGFTLPNAQAYAEFVAVYGGLEFGVGVFFLYSATSAVRRATGVVFGACFYLGICVFRISALWRVGTQIGNGVNFFALECLFALISLALLGPLAVRSRSEK